MQIVSDSIDVNKCHVVNDKHVSVFVGTKAECEAFILKTRSAK